MIDFCLESRETRLRNGQMGRRQLVGASLPVVLHHIALSKLLKEVLVMSDDYELEVCVIPALIDNAARCVWCMVSTASVRWLAENHSLHQAGS